jgi:hypothetical protein
VRPVQALALNLGYRKAIDNPLPGWPIPNGDRNAIIDWKLQSQQAAQAHRLADASASRDG